MPIDKRLEKTLLGVRGVDDQANLFSSDYQALIAQNIMIFAQPHKKNRN
jgi:hypothetical protein